MTDLRLSGIGMTSARTRARMVEAREQRRFLAKIPRQRDDLDIQRHGRQRSRDVAGAVGTAVVDINDLQAQSALDLQKARDFGDALMQGGEAARLVEQGHDDRQRRCGWGGPRACASFGRLRGH